MKKFIRSSALTLLLACMTRGGLANYTQAELRQICNDLAPNIEDAGFVCLDANSPQYLRCHDPELVWVMMDCSPPLKCTTPVMTWNIYDPCGWPTVPVCGDGKVEGEEQCELGGVGCSDQCMCLAGYLPTDPVSKDCVSTNVCGDGDIDGEEQCEIGGVGCGADCKCQEGFMPTTPVSIDCAPVPLCGNGVVNDGEQCEVGGIGCTANCTCATGYEPTTPVTFDCSPVSLCGNGQLDSGEVCEVGGIGCSATCTCENGFRPTTPVSIDCEQIPPPEPFCGDGMVNGNEQCEVGGVGCTADCMCQTGYSPSNPPLFDCVKDVVPPVCGNGVINDGEQCEVGGIGCTADCMCQQGYIPADPAGVDCILDDSRPYITERDLCVWFTDSDEDAGFVCLSENSTEYLRCHLLEQVATMMPCPAGTRCRAPVDVFTIYNPCIWESPFPVEDYLWIYDGEERSLDNYNRTSLCGNGRLDDGEQCERGGAGCTIASNSQCVCAEYFRPNTPATLDCVLDTDAVCAKIFSDTQRQISYFCPSSLYDSNSSVVIKCDGATATVEACETNNFCTSDGSFEQNPCASPAVNRCGDGEINVGEECDSGLGCTENCTCAQGYIAATPATPSCIPFVDNETIDNKALCQELNGTGFFCTDQSMKNDTAPTNAFIWCVNGQYVTKMNCPLGTVCGIQGLTQENPCILPNICGNGVIDGNEECEVGGLGCNPLTCKCAAGFSPMNPPAQSCKFNNAAELCSQNIQEPHDDNFFGCIEGLENYYVMCPGDSTEPFVEQCPKGTTCSLQTFAPEVPCLN